MNTPPPATSRGEKLTEDAAYWCMRLHDQDCTDEERLAFQHWVDADPDHAREFAEMLEIWDISSELPKRRSPLAAQPASIIEFPKPAPRQSGRLRRMAVAAALALFVLPVAGYTGWSLGLVPNDYRRYEAENSRRHVVLPDGSEVDLNLGTRLSYANFKDQRSVSLSQGEAYFHVAHDSRHPFVVSAASGTITVTGTRFNVWKYQDEVVVTVTEGSVRVSSDRQRNQGSTLTPGMQARYHAQDYLPAVGPADTSATLAWRDGKLILDDMSLAEALPLINRYLDRPVLLADPATAQVRVGGIYNTRDIHGLVNTLPKVLPLKISKNQEGSTVLSLR
ncbi:MULTISPECIES: FecR family protein [Pseudomonas]|uniref:FecR family protein n=1 Tax=Pseudomonadaceae TaxID=135621 RepID=UPI00042179B9|nr:MULTISPECIES: FecR family protein [Pseudomonas]